MPLYKNVNSTRKLVGSHVVNPYEKYESMVHLNENEVELLKVSELPYYNPVLVSECITETKVIKIPYAEKYSIHYYVEQGEVEINYDSLSNKPSLKLYTGAKWTERCLQRYINKIFITGAGFKCWIIVERI